MREIVTTIWREWAAMRGRYPWTDPCPFWLYVVTIWDVTVCWCHGNDWVGAQHGLGWSAKDGWQ